MGWSLGCKPVEKTSILTQFFVATGKSLYLATEYEQKCRGILRVLEMASAFEECGDASTVLSMKLEDLTLYKSLKKIVSLAPTTSGYFETLKDAKDARNYIAHEAASLGFVADVSDDIIDSRLADLKVQLSKLVAGDNLVSSWLYEIQEKEPAPRIMVASYPNLVDTWVFGDHGTVEGVGE